MINIIDTYPQIGSLFENGVFQRANWEVYINSVYANSAHVFIDDMNECLDGGNYTYEKDVLPILSAVHGHSKLETLHSSFCEITGDLNKKVIDCFGHELDIDIVLYVGLCNGAGWVTNINGRDVILLGVEKILELNWCDINAMRGLIYHELGHVYHKQYGKFHQHSEDSRMNFVWQLFTEGIAMYFEQELVKDCRYFHQDVDGWLSWCESHFQQILADFYNDLPTMARSNQRYFGDWVSYHGKGDVGYYLGTRFVQKLNRNYDFDRLINLDIDSVYREYIVFVESNGGFGQ